MTVRKFAVTDVSLERTPGQGADELGPVQRLP